MNTGDLGDFFSLTTLPKELRESLLFATPEQEDLFLKRCRYAFEEASQSLGFQDLEPISWVVSPGTLLMDYPEGFGLPLGVYGFGFFRPRQDGEVVLYLNGHDQPLHAPSTPPDPSSDYWGSPQGLVLGMQKLARELGNTGGGFDGYVEVIQIEGNPLLPEQTLAALCLYAYFPQEVESKSEIFLGELSTRFPKIFKTYHGILIPPKSLIDSLTGAANSPEWGLWIPLPPFIDQSGESDTKIQKIRELIRSFPNEQEPEEMLLYPYTLDGLTYLGVVGLPGSENQKTMQSYVDFLERKRIRVIAFNIPKKGTFAINL